MRDVRILVLQEGEQGEDPAVARGLLQKFGHPQGSGATPLNQKQEAAARARLSPDPRRHAGRHCQRGSSCDQALQSQQCFKANCITFMLFGRLANSCICELSGVAKNRAGGVAGSYSKPSPGQGAFEGSSRGVGKHELSGPVWWPQQGKGQRINPSPQRETWFVK